MEAINKSILFLDETTQYVREIRDQYPRSEDGVKSSHRWSGKTTDLVELVYALHNSRCIDEGNITIEQLSEYVGRIFGVEMKNKYITYSEIKRRGKDSRTYFLDRLSAGLNEKMAEDDAI
ncbi:MAG: RteC domain-containing protein [Rikenellaceae bacterium]